MPHVLAALVVLDFIFHPSETAPGFGLQLSGWPMWPGQKSVNALKRASSTKEGLPSGCFPSPLKFCVP